jgi:hypothetical protein
LATTGAADAPRKNRVEKTVRTAAERIVVVVVVVVVVDAGCRGGPESGRYGKLSSWLSGKW